LVVVLRVHHEGIAQLAHVGDTGRHPRLVPGLGEDREKDRGQNGDDRYHDKQLDQGKATALSHRMPPLLPEGKLASLFPAALNGAFGPSRKVPPRPVVWVQVTIMSARVLSGGSPPGEGDFHLEWVRFRFSFRHGWPPTLSFAAPGPGSGGAERHCSIIRIIGRRGQDPQGSNGGS